MGSIGRVYIAPMGHRSVNNLPIDAISRRSPHSICCGCFDRSPASGRSRASATDVTAAQLLADGGPMKSLSAAAIAEE
jgi:hypothetical protein